MSGRTLKRTAPVVWFALIMLCGAAAAADPQRPMPPRVFTSSMVFHMVANDGVPFDMSGYMELDANSKGMRWEMQDYELTGYALNLTSIFGEDFEYALTQGVCRPYSGQYFPIFWFVPSAEYVGTEYVNGTECDTWAHVAGESTYSITVMSSDTSRVVSAVYDLVFGSSTLYESYTFPLDGVWQLSVDPWAFDVPERCYHTGGFLCPSGDVVTMEMIRFHAADDYDITNKNTADYLGDTAFLCTGLDTQNKNQIISLYVVEVNTQWGQYALCNNDVCVGGTNHTVGHEGSFGLPPFGGQCRSNEAYGNWFSLPGVSRCNGTTPVSNSTEGCAWKEQQLVKSITLDCLISVGFGEACEEDGYTLPFERATQSLMDAIQYDYASQGGCPNVYNSTASAVDDDSLSRHHSALRGAAQEHPTRLMRSRLDHFAEAMQRTSDLVNAILARSA